MLGSKTTFSIDIKAISKALEDKEQKILEKFGRYVATTAKRSMRTRKKPSAAGSPPSAHNDGRTRYGPLLKKLYGAYWDPTTRSIIVGPKGQAGKNAPSLQEYGGTKIIKIKKIPPKSGRKATPAQAAAYKRKLKDGSIVKKAPVIETKTVHLPARPYSRPALAANLPKFPTLFAGQITG